MAIKECFLVLGPEGSGTYMMAEALRKVACDYVDKEENLEHVFGKCRSDKIVVRRSYPHRGRWPMINRLAHVITDCGWNITVLAMIREPNAAALSVERRNNTPYYRSLENQTYAYRRIFELSGQFPVIPVPYLTLVSSSGFRHWLFEDRLGLLYPDTYKFRNENQKYY